MAATYNSIVIVPCWRRPDFLQVTLEHIAAARGAENNYYLFAVDNRPDQGVYDVIRSVSRAENFSGETRIQSRRVTEGNTGNILDAFSYALKIRDYCGARLVYLIE